MPRPAPKPYDSNDAPEIVSGRWLAKGFGIVALAALICSYLSLCLLYYLGQWQIVLHPDPAAAKQTAPPGLIHFGTDETGRPQLTGEWLPAGEDSHYGQLTILLLPAGDGSRKNAEATVHALHDIGLNVFSFDYRGYGLSATVHPSQQRMTDDANSAWRYLTGSRGVPATKIIPYGIGTGASLAAALAAAHHEIQAVILDRPHVDLRDFAAADRRSGLLPTGMLFHEHFPLAAPLTSLATPKLLISKQGKTYPAFASAGSPRMSVELSESSGPLFAYAVRRFIDQYLPAGK
jgi:alpha-beta hydrolase superfamily lysophospholipase